MSSAAKKVAGATKFVATAYERSQDDRDYGASVIASFRGRSSDGETDGLPALGRDRGDEVRAGLLVRADNRPGSCREGRLPVSWGRTAPGDADSASTAVRGEHVPRQAGWPSATGLAVEAELRGNMQRRDRDLHALRNVATGPADVGALSRRGLELDVRAADR